MSVRKARAKVLKGLSIDIADLMLIRGRAEARSLRMVVRVDHGSSVGSCSRS